MVIPLRALLAASTLVLAASAHGAPAADETFASVRGTVVLPAGSGPCTAVASFYRVRPTPARKPAYVADLRPEREAPDGATRLRFSLPEVRPARYFVRVGSLGFVQEVEVPASGLDELRIEVPADFLPLSDGESGARPDHGARTSCLVVTKGITGGFRGPLPERRVAFAYDWNRDVYRAVEWTWSDQVRRCELSRVEFERILAEVARRGLPDLPLEEPRESEDLYGEDTGVLFCHGGRSWENRAPGGCVQRRSKVRPTAEELEVFRSILAFVDETIVGLPMRPAAVPDLAVAILEEEDGAAGFAHAVDRLRSDPLRAQIDFNRVLVRGNTFWFAFRGAQHAVDGMPEHWPGYVRITAHPSGHVSHVERWLPLPRYLTGGERREAFLRDHPELPPHRREAIRAGWIAPGMTLEMVVAAWGEPDRVWSRDGVDQHIYEWTNGTRQLTFPDGVLETVPFGWIRLPPRVRRSNYLDVLRASR